MSCFSVLALPDADVQEFVRFWSSRYRDSDDAYDSNIHLGEELTGDNVVALLDWKAQGRFPRSKDYGTAVGLETINSGRSKQTFSSTEIQELHKELRGELKNAGLNISGAIVWIIFLCHLSNPEEIPIYDVNVWTAWGFIEEWLEPIHLKQRPTKFDTYLEYRMWFNQLARDNGLNRRTLDKALMAFGSFVRKNHELAFS
jgi:hypothetical protein